MKEALLRGINPLFAAMLLATAGCSSSEPAAAPAAPQREVVVQTKEASETEEKNTAPTGPEPEAPAEAEHDHEHVAPHGGTLVSLRDHVGHLEFVLDKAAGVLTMYVLDGHAEQPVRLTYDTMMVTLHDAANAKFVDLQLKPVENELTGEKVGDSSQFVAGSEDLKGFDRFTIMLPAFEFKGVVLPSMNASFPEGDMKENVIPG